MGPGLTIGVAGAPGRMGRAVARVIEAREGLAIGTLFGRPDAVGKAPDTVEEALDACDVIIDFSSAASSADLAARAAARGGPALVIGSTGFSAAQDAAVDVAAKRIAIVKSNNFSVGVTLLATLVEQAAARLGPELWDIEVAEAHHRGKLDAPSGTALLLAKAAARGRGEALAEITAPAREGVRGARREGAIGFSVLRGGGIVGEHAVVFAAEDEILTLSHSARDRRLFANGAVRAAAWVAGRAPGLYGMRDVLGL
ncbi:MAG: 4-hydroxy-tetrahydrodipicolinate reductase [Caulobacteraceae bacterium]|nr:4-hydroxy-tetrahydrodipicolinate reductase [Caulobacteraceae bacterium]